MKQAIICLLVGIVMISCGIIGMSQEYHNVIMPMLALLAFVIGGATIGISLSLFFNTKK